MNEEQLSGPQSSASNRADSPCLHIYIFLSVDDVSADYFKGKSDIKPPLDKPKKAQPTISESLRRSERPKSALSNTQ